MIPRSFQPLAAAVVATSMWACSPSLNWREVRPPDSSIVALFPCKPSGQERQVLMAGQPVGLTLLACEAGGLTWGLASADMANPALLGAALTELRQAAAANIDATTVEPTALQVRGATPHPQSVRLRLAGRRPDGRAAQMQAAFFTHGTWVYQVTVLGEQVRAEDADTFFAALRFIA